MVQPHLLDACAAFFGCPKSRKRMRFLRQLQPQTSVAYVYVRAIICGLASLACGIFASLAMQCILHCIVPHKLDACAAFVL